MWDRESLAHGAGPSEGADRHAGGRVVRRVERAEAGHGVDDDGPVRRPLVLAIVREIWDQYDDTVAALVRRVDPEASRTEARCRAMLIVTLLDGSSIQSYAASGRLSRRAMASELATAALRIARGR